MNITSCYKNNKLMWSSFNLFCEYFFQFFGSKLFLSDLVEGDH